MKNNVLIIGNSDGIGLAITRELLEQNWNIIGISRSATTIHHPAYQHHIIEVQQGDYQETLNTVLQKMATLDLCIYCPGIGELLDLQNMQSEIQIFEVNLLGMVKTTAAVIPKMVGQASGHFIGLSSVADALLSSEAPSYHASKAGFSNYLEGLALALKTKGVKVTNVRFGFVDTKMAKSDIKPFLIGVDQAAAHLIKCIERKPIRYTAPRIIIPFIRFRRWMQEFGIK